MTGSFDGHANCFVESGDDKALLIDFNYDTQPLPGKYPLPLLGPMSLLKETRANHLGKLAFRHIYWNVLLPGRPVPLAVPHVDGRASTTRARRPDAMTMTTIDGHLIHVNDEGFMTDPNEWSEELAKSLAAQIGIDLTDEHWKAIRFLRDDYAKRARPRRCARISVVGGIPTKSLFQLFPQKPAKKLAYIAGLPKPHGCV